MKETKPIMLIARITEKQAAILADIAQGQGVNKSEALRQLLTEAGRRNVQADKLETEIYNPALETKGAHHD